MCADEDILTDFCREFGTEKFGDGGFALSADFGDHYDVSAVEIFVSSVFMLVMVLLITWFSSR